MLKFEPFVLHVQCRDLPASKKLHVAASEAGFRNSGLSLGGDGLGQAGVGKIVVAVRSTHGLEVPLTNDEGEELVTETFFNFCVEKANTKLEGNLTRIRKFEEKLKGILEKVPKKEKKDNKQGKGEDRGRFFSSKLEA